MSEAKNLVTLERGMHVLRAFQTSDDGLTNAELSSRTGIPKSAVSRITQTLLDLGFLNHAGRKSKFRPGPGLLALGRVASDTYPVLQSLKVAQQQMADDSNVQIMMTTRENTHLMFVSACLPSNGSIPFYDVGHRIPLVGSASGACLLAALPDGALGTLIPKLSDTYGVSEIEVFQIQRRVRDALLSDGFYQPPDENYFNPDIRAVAVPMMSESLGQPLIVSAVVGRDAKTSVEMQEYIGPKLVRLLLDADEDLKPLPQTLLASEPPFVADRNVTRPVFGQNQNNKSKSES